VRNFPGENCSPAFVNNMSSLALQLKKVQRPTMVRKETPPPRGYRRRDILFRGWNDGGDDGQRWSVKLEILSKRGVAIDESHSYEISLADLICGDMNDSISLL
jgi:hypothetical protein